MNFVIFVVFFFYLKDVGVWEKVNFWMIMVKGGEFYNENLKVWIYMKFGFVVCLNFDRFVYDFVE